MARRLAAVAIALIALGTTSFAFAQEIFKDDLARKLSLSAETARAAGRYEPCMEDDEESLSREDHVSVRVHFAGCAEHAGKIVSALKHLQPVLENALKNGDTELAELARRRVEQLLKKVGALTITLPPGVTGVVVSIDDSSVDVDTLAKSITVDPGEHRVHVEASGPDGAGTFDDVVKVEEGGRATVSVVLKTASKFLTPGQLECLRQAGTPYEARMCIGMPEKSLIARVALEMSFYEDTFAVRILNPSVRANVSSPTAGWNVGASYLVDVVSAASPDIISTASPRGADTRHAVSVNGGWKPNLFAIEGGALFSTESDYVSRSGNVGVSYDLLDKRVTPRLGYALSYDTIGRGGTPYDVFHHNLTSHEISAGTTIVIGPTTVLVAGVSGAFERGDQSKPYRLIPMFANGVSVAAGASADDVNAKRLAVRPYEQLPLQRDRYSLDARLNQRIATSTLRVEERLYDDSWQIKATSTDIRWLFDIGPRVTLGPHARFHAQTGANFQQRVYHATTDPSVVVPIYRTTDRELSPLLGVTGGGSVRWRLNEYASSIGWTIYGSGDALYSRYFDSLYATHRWAGYGTIGVEAELE